MTPPRAARPLATTALGACVLLLLALVLVACTKVDEPNGAADAANGLPCDVAEVFARHCQTCHSQTPQYGAPMPLVTHANLMAPAKSDPARRVFERVSARIHDDARPMPQPPN